MPVVISRSAAVPVPPPAAFTLICTAFAVALVVVIELPAFMVKLSAPAPFLFAAIVTVPLPALTAPFKVTAFWALSWMSLVVVTAGTVSAFALVTVRL